MESKSPLPGTSSKSPHISTTTATGDFISTTKDGLMTRASLPSEYNKEGRDKPKTRKNARIAKALAN